MSIIILTIVFAFNYDNDDKKRNTSFHPVFFSHHKTKTQHYTTQPD